MVEEQAPMSRANSRPKSARRKPSSGREETNVKREVPIEANRIAARLNAPAAMDDLEDIQRHFRALYEQCSQPGADLKRLNTAGRALTRWHTAIHRNLRLAELCGPGAEPEGKEPEVVVWSTAVTVEDGITPRPTPLLGAQAPDIAPETASTRSPVESGEAEGVPESNDLYLQ